MTKVGIIYGWSEGRAHGKQFRKALKKHGLTHTRKLSDADALVVHSGGYFLIPNDSKAKVILLINYPNWEGKPIRKSLKQKLTYEFNQPNNLRHEVRKFIYNVIYLTIRPLHHIRIRLGYKKAKHPKAISSYIVIRNKQDTYMHPDTTLKQAEKRGWNVMSMPGLHDDVWQYPDSYIILIKKSLKDKQNNL